MSITELQILTAVVWFVVALVTTPGTYRAIFTARATRTDPWKAVCFFTAVIFVGGSSRWLLRPDDVLGWKAVYALTILLAVCVLVLAWNERRP